ncbi:MAG: phosphatase PAP2 family protein [Chitinophagaceae bacterium]
MKNIFFQERGFLTTFILCWIVGFWVCLGIEKGGEILWIQKHYFLLANWIFTFLTLIIENPISVILIFVILLLSSYQNFIFLVLNYVLTGGIILCLKEYFQHDRPFLFFSKIQITLNYLTYIDPLLLVSFPSGHSEAAIVFGFTLSLIVRKQIYKIIIAAIAICACFSRVYLMQHFLQDILAGSLLGAMMSMVWLYLYRISFSNKIADVGLWHTLRQFKKRYET